jgi:hypothetical protein
MPFKFARRLNEILTLNKKITSIGCDFYALHILKLTLNQTAFYELH